MRSTHLDGLLLRAEFRDGAPLRLISLIRASLDLVEKSKIIFVAESDNHRLAEPSVDELESIDVGFGRWISNCLSVRISSKIM